MIFFDLIETPLQKEKYVHVCLFMSVAKFLGYQKIIKVIAVGYQITSDLRGMILLCITELWV